MALEQYYDFRRNLADGVLPGSVGFQKLMDVYLQYIEHEGKHAYHSATAKRHFLPFFKNVKDITRITLADVTRYIEHRRNKNESPPLPQTLNRENTVLRQIFAHAVKQGWLREAVKIENLSERLHRRRRRHFTLEEYRQLHRTCLGSKIKWTRPT